MSSCLFCSIAQGATPAEIVSTTEHTVAFRDIYPVASTHILVVPRVHYPNIASLAEAEPIVAAELLEHARQVAAIDGHEDFRLVFNTGELAGQTVFHVHGHVMAGPELRDKVENKIDALTESA